MTISFRVFATIRSFYEDVRFQLLATPEEKATNKEARPLLGLWKAAARWNGAWVVKLERLKFVAVYPDGRVDVLDGPEQILARAM